MLDAGDRDESRRKEGVTFQAGDSVNKGRAHTSRVILDSDLTPVGLSFLICTVSVSTVKLNCKQAPGSLSTEPDAEKSSPQGSRRHHGLQEGARAQRPHSAPGTELVRGWAGPEEPEGRRSRRGGAAAPAPPPRHPSPSSPRASRAQSGGSSGRGNTFGSGSSRSRSRSGPARPHAPGPRAPTPPPRLPGASGAPAARLTLKFLAVLLAAGMLAFLGAVICIIASVPLAASPARALPGGADNASGAAASPGPQRSLSALHRAGGSAGPPALPGAPAASAHPLPPVPLFSRFLCTPLAAACPSGAEQGDAAPSEREELLLLQSTAEQLRQTALQQEARIRADQDTIRELTGKLGRCESGLPRGLQDAGPRRDAMADGPWDSPALIVELEDAVRALRDRIDRIEQELPARVNFSAAPAPAPVVPTTLHSEMDELEGQLLAKVLALEKERVALGHSSQQQRQEVEKELGALQDRVAELERGSSAYSPPDAFKISIPIRNNYMYARVRKALPELYAFSVCMWLRSRSGGTGQGTPFSYSVPGQANEIVLLEAGHDPMELLINDKVAQLPLSLKDNGWHHICLSWTTRDGLWSAYQDGELQGSGENLAAWHPIKPHGILILGQEQDTLGGRFDATQAFVGDIAQFNLWDHTLTPAQVLGIANCTGPLLGNIIPWEDKLVETFGGATKAAFDVCKGRAKA
ncbi:neuronal pentraxin receptor [Mesoplodon densirostris]|uniref:neuronal pentraxin receptor n=1 Tax=Mesoplodon densirostris TaxID=48708 RepID=UPI0028DD3C51|nr:neuronal pentraxin receptor [Mesoplodon densirostris]